MTTTVVITRRHNELDPSVSTDEYTYGEHVVEVHTVERYGCMVYDVTFDVWLGEYEFLTPLCAQLLAFETLGVVDK